MLRSVAIACAVISTTATLSCKDESGSSTDFFYALKHPDGGKYSYRTTGSFSLSDYDLVSDTDKGAIAMTLQQVYGGSSLFLNRTDGRLVSANASILSARERVHLESFSTGDFAYAMYNDEKPSGQKTTDYAHSKGVMAFDGESGFWLIHSMPKYPKPVSEGYSGVPDDKYGQSFICVTFSSSEFDTIGSQMQINYPWLYDSNVPATLQGTNPNFDAWVNGGKSSTLSNEEILHSKGGEVFHHLAKSKQANMDLYEDLVAPSLDADLWVETWQNGGGNCGSYCKSKYKYDVTDVQTISLDGDEWKINQDHSKWAVSTTKSWTCVGDINRQISQEVRGGGTLCRSDSSTHTAFVDAIATKNEC